MFLVTSVALALMMVTATALAQEVVDPKDAERQEEKCWEYAEEIFGSAETFAPETDGLLEEEQTDIDKAVEKFNENACWEVVPVG